MLLFIFSMSALVYDQINISGFVIRMIRLDGEWRYPIKDVIIYITRSSRPEKYIPKRISRMSELKASILRENLEGNVKKLLIQTDKGYRLANCANLAGLWYLTKILPPKYSGRVRILKSRIG